MQEAAFKKKILKFYHEHKRNFPWRETSNPYFILVSEIMLQQTQTSRVIEKYREFITAFPTIFALATASLSQVLMHWSGLGYNRRAKYLHMTAQAIVSEHDGHVPRDPGKLSSLPGIGPNTAAAIVVYAYNIPVTFIETNIRRTFIHHFFATQKEVSDKEIFPLVSATMDQINPREWFWALMDYGSALPKVVKNPNHKSVHYTKQSKFSGSVRQVRGSIMKTLLKGPCSQSSLKTQVEGDLLHFEKALKALMEEGFVVKKGSQYCIQ